MGDIAEKLAILDAGAQYSKLIDRQVRLLGVESDIVPLDAPIEQLRPYRAYIISGSGGSVIDDPVPYTDIFGEGKPVLGICYGIQLMNQKHGGTVERKEIREDDDAPIKIVYHDSHLFRGLHEQEPVLLTHGDSIGLIAPGFRVTAYSGTLVAAIENEALAQYGVQFHPETERTPKGPIIISNFLDIAGFRRLYTPWNKLERSLDYIRKAAGDDHVLVQVSGGVDSTVAAVLVKQALGEKRVTALHFNHGYMRKGESIHVEAALRNAGIDAIVIDATDRFYGATTSINGRITLPLNQVIDPEDKRNIIGDMLVVVTDEVAREKGLDLKSLKVALGTTRPDDIESASASKKAKKIKTHHNRSGLVQDLIEKGKVIEPLKELHKDEVRELGEMLYLPPEIIWRHPFPGPGLAIRVLCTEESFIDESFNPTNQRLWYLTNYEKSPETFKDFVKTSFDSELEARLKTVEGIFATLLPIKTVGVQGDDRSYSYLATLSGKQDWDTLFFLASLIPKINRNVNRIVYAFGEPIHGPVTEITRTRLTRDVITQVRDADDIVTQILLKYDLMRKLDQVPVVSFPVPFGIIGNRSIAIRTILTKNYMTGIPAYPGKNIPMEALEEMVSRILREVPHISRVVYDLTGKPPATIEWE